MLALPTALGFAGENLAVLRRQTRHSAAADFGEDAVQLFGREADGTSRDDRSGGPGEIRERDALRVFVSPRRWPRSADMRQRQGKAEGRDRHEACFGDG